MPIHRRTHFAADGLTGRCLGRLNRGTLSEQLGAGRLAPDLAPSTSINVLLERACFCDGASIVGR
jgi:hypothetical protein